MPIFTTDAFLSHPFLNADASYSHSSLASLTPSRIPIRCRYSVFTPKVSLFGNDKVENSNQPVTTTIEAPPDADRQTRGWDFIWDGDMPGGEQ